MTEYKYTTTIKTEHGERVFTYKGGSSEGFKWALSDALRDFYQCVGNEGTIVSVSTILTVSSSVDEAREKWKEEHCERMRLYRLACQRVGFDTAICDYGTQVEVEQRALAHYSLLEADDGA